MGKSVCCACGKELGLFSGKICLKDGHVCAHCLKQGGLSSLTDSRQYTASYIENIVNSRKDVLQKYKRTKQFDQIEIDINHKIFCINRNLFLFSDLVSYCLYEDPSTNAPSKKTGTSNGAAIGSVIGGFHSGIIGSAVGATVGAAIGSLFSSVCNSLSISITLKDTPITDIQLSFISEKTKTSSPEYSEAIRKAESCIEALSIISQQNETDMQAQPSARNASVSSYTTSDTFFIQDQHLSASQLADELAVYKTLLYNGDITQEEYEQKRKQLLSLR